MLPRDGVNCGYFLYLAQRMCQIESAIVAVAGYSAQAAAQVAEPAALAESVGVGAASPASRAFAPYAAIAAAGREQKLPEQPLPAPARE